MTGFSFRMHVSAAAPEIAASKAAAAIPAGAPLYYALGGGLGHLMRAYAISRALERQEGPPLVVLTNCRFALPEVPLRLQLEDRPDAAGLARLLEGLVSALQPAAFIVDAFPAGILNELPALLPTLNCPKFAVIRRLQPAWVERWNLTRVLNEHYDDVIAVEPGSEIAGVRAFEIPPILACDAADLLDPTVARAAFGITGDTPLIVAAVTGATPADQGLLSAARRAVTLAAPQAHLQFASPWVFRGQELSTQFDPPLMRHMRGIDLLIGPCGYHLAHESAASGTPAIFVPQQRTYDDQRARAAQRTVARSPDQLTELITASLANTTLLAAHRHAPAYDNGALRFVECLLHRLGATGPSPPWR